MKLAFAYSGQGSQKVGMGKDLYSQNEIFKSAFDLLTDEKKQIAFEGPIEDLSKTINTQGILTAFCVGITDMLKQEGITPFASLGLSLGEYSALYSANVFSKEQVIDLINFRASEMTKSAQGIECKMAAILQLSKEEIQSACDTASSQGIVSIANLNCPGQIVISGEAKAVEKAAEICLEKGAKRAIFLQTEGAFHTKIMEGAYKALENRFKSEEFNEPDFPVILNTVARSAKGLGELKQLLALQVKSSVNFEESIKELETMGVDTIIEIGQGKTLASFIKKTASNIKVYNIEDMDSFNKTVLELKNT